MHADEKLTAFVELRICDSRLQRVYLTCGGDFFKTWQRQKDLNQAEIRRVLATGAQFLYTDLLPVQRWADVQVILNSLGFTIRDERHIGPNVPASCGRCHKRPVRLLTKCFRATAPRE